MLTKHRQILILLVGLLYVYSVCPFLCATLEQKSCHNGFQKVLSGDVETRSTCCQITETDAAGTAETPSGSSNPCCSKDLELVLPDDGYNTQKLNESIEQSLVSILPVSVTLPVTPWESFKNSPVPLTSTFFLDHSLSRRGPPFTQC